MLDLLDVIYFSVTFESIKDIGMEQVTIVSFYEDR